MTKPHERLVQARIDAGFNSANAASSAFGWPQRSYIRHEKGLAPFNHLAEKYAKAFDVTVKDLIGDEPPVWRGRGRAKPFGDLPIIRPNDINAITEIMRGLSPLAEADNRLSYGPNTFSVSGLDSPLVPRGGLAVFDPDAEPQSGDYVLAYDPDQVLPVLATYSVDSSMKIIAKLVLIAIPAYTLS